MITDIEYRAFYQIEGNEGTEVLHVNNTGPLSFLRENGESMGWEEYPEDDVAQAIMGLLHRSSCEGYRVDSYEEDGEEVLYFTEYSEDFWPIESITYHEGWFAVIFEGPFESYDDALAGIEEAVGSDEENEEVEEEVDYQEDSEDEEESDEAEEDSEEDSDEDDSDEDEDDDDDDEGGEDEDDDDGEDSEEDRRSQTRIKLGKSNS